MGDIPRAAAVVGYEITLPILTGYVIFNVKVNIWPNFFLDVLKKKAYVANYRGRADDAYSELTGP